jgi:hypothetical protein
MRVIVTIKKGDLFAGKSFMVSGNHVMALKTPDKLIRFFTD